MNSIHSIVGQHKHSVARLFKKYGIHKPVTRKNLAAAIVVYKAPHGNPFLDELHNDIAASPAPALSGYDDYEDYDADYDGYDDYDDGYDDFGKGKGKAKRQARRTARKDKRAARKAKKQGVYTAETPGYSPPDSGTGATANQSNGDWSEKTEKGIGFASGVLDVIGKGKSVFSTSGGGGGGGGASEDESGEDGNDTLSSKDKNHSTGGRPLGKNEKILLWSGVGLVAVIIIVVLFRSIGKK